MKSILLACATAIALAGSAQAQSDTLIASGSVWTYLDDGSDQGSAWQPPAFDDSGWSTGSAELGYGDGDEVTVIGFGGNALDKHVTTYFRHEFDIVDASLYDALTVELLRDDGAAVHLNGVELLRHNLPAGPIDSSTLALFEVEASAESTFYSSDHASSALVNGTNVIAVEIHQADSAGPDISFDLKLVGHQEPLLYRGPYLQKGSEDSITVRWRTFPASDSRVWYGASPGSLTSTSSDASLVEDHELELTGLAADSTYYYAIGTSAGPIAGADADHFFVTHPPLGDPRPARYWVLGDSGTASSDAAAVRDAYEAFTGPVHTDLWLMLGDNAYLLGLDEEYQFALFDFYPAMLRKSALWPARGNRDTSGPVFYGIFSLPTAAESGGVPSGTEAWFSFDHGRVHFICLDSTASDRSIGGPMWTWLQSDLLATDQEWIIAFWHHPPYSKGGHDSDVAPAQIQMRENFGPLLESGGVDLVLSGHCHSYERSFLIDGHYGDSSTLAPSMIKDDGDGRESGTGAYNKSPGPNRGTVYAVGGSSGGSNAISTLHPAMFIALGLPGSIVIDVSEGRLDVSFLSSLGVVEDQLTLLSENYTGSYCTTTPHSEACTATMSAAGSASATSASPFYLQATAIPQNKPGLLFYGFGPTRLPFFNGSRCVAAPLKRTQVQFSAGAGPCTGSFTYDFNARIQSGNDPALLPGVTVYSQYWFRDAGSSNTSEAYQFVIGP